MENQIIDSQVNLIRFYLDNFDQLFNQDLYYSLNGWKIDDNNFNFKENIFAGLIFGLLICSFYIFFRSKYFRKFLSN